MAVGRLRIALAAFDDGERLRAALNALSKANVADTQKGVAARRPQIESLLRAAIPLGRLTTVPFTANGDETLASDGPFWSALNFFAKAAGQPLIVAPWMAPRLRDELCRHISDGATLLGARATTTEQQKQCTQILLNCSSHRVHTHEFTL